MAKDISNQIDKNIISEMKAMDKLPIMIPDENTPKGTIVRCKQEYSSFSQGFLFIRVNRVPERVIVTKYITDINNESYYEVFDKAEIDIEADLQFRAFLNAPKEYRWFAIDSDGRGFVYRNKPILDAHNNWLNEEFSGDICNVGASIGVGLFLQYAELFGKILIERKD